MLPLGWERAYCFVGLGVDDGEALSMWIYLRYQGWEGPWQRESQEGQLRFSAECRLPWTDTWQNLSALSSSTSTVTTSTFCSLQPMSLALKGPSLPVPSLPARGVRSVVASVSWLCACLALASVTSRLHFWSLGRTSMKAPGSKGNMKQPCGLRLARQHNTGCRLRSACLERGVAQEGQAQRIAFAPKQQPKEDLQNYNQYS